MTELHPGRMVLGDDELRDGFERFVAAAHRLEHSYRELRRRAAAIDGELTATNAHLERTLAERETILGALPVGVVALDADARPVWRNQEAERLVADVGESVAASEPGEHRFAGTTVRVRRVALPDGGALVVLEDRSHVAALEREVDRLDRLAGLSELALGIAHEIKNPLHGVIGFASLMERTTDPANLQRFAQRVREGLVRVDDIVRALLAFARPTDAGVQRLPVRDVAQQAASEVGLPRSALALRGDLDAAVDAPVVRRVLANLFRNSVEAAEGAVRVELVAQCGAAGIVLTVSDDGPGVSEAIEARLFEPFVSTKQDGHGLGLALASRVLAYLGGTLRLVPPEGRGARFVVELPAFEEATA